MTGLESEKVRSRTEVKTTSKRPLLRALTPRTAQSRDTALPQFARGSRRCAASVRRWDSRRTKLLPCAHCGGRLRLIATLHDPALIRKILAHLALGHSGQ